MAASLAMRRAPLLYTSLVEPRSPVLRRTGLRAASRRTGDGPVERLVRTRAGAACEACGGGLGRDGGGILRRCARGAPDCTEVVMCSAANWVLLCPRHIELAEVRDQEMRSMGFWLSSGRDPRQEPILLRGAGDRRVTVWLDAGGRYLFEAPEA
jgi:hypothetical protein